MVLEFPPPGADSAVRYVLPLSRDSARHGQVNVNGQPMAQGGGEEEVLSSHRLLRETGRSGNSASDGRILFQNGPFWKFFTLRVSPPARAAPNLETKGERI